VLVGGAFGTECVDAWTLNVTVGLGGSLCCFCCCCWNGLFVAKPVLVPGNRELEAIWSSSADCQLAISEAGAALHSEEAGGGAEAKMANWQRWSAGLLRSGGHRMLEQQVL